MSLLLAALASAAQAQYGGPAGAPVPAGPAAPAAVPTPAADDPAGGTAATTGIAAPTATPGQSIPAAIIAIEGPIDDFTFSVMDRQIDAALREGAQVLIFRINTPGGALGATLSMTRRVRGLSGVTTIAFIEEQAYSAGTIFAVALDRIYMGPESVLGDCAPIAVTATGLQNLADAERAKLSSPVVADMYASAMRNGHNPDMLAAMVLPGRIVHALRSPDGRMVIVDDVGYTQKRQEGYVPVEGVPDPLDAADTLLTLDNRTAERVGLSRGTLPSVEALAAQYGWTITQRFEPTAGQRIVQWLNSPALRGILVSVFMISMYLSFQAPGHGLPEAVCMTALATLLIVPLMTGYASWIELLLILAGVALIALELFVISGTFVPGLIGAGMVLTGLVLTFVPREAPIVPGEWTPPSLPTLPGTWAALQTGLGVVVIALLVSLGVMYWLTRFLPKVPYAGRLVLQAQTAAGGVGSVLVDSPEQEWPPVGALAEAATDLRPGGSARFPDPEGHGSRTVGVVSDSGFIPAGSRVRVVQVEGPHILVRKLRDEGGST